MFVVQYGKMFYKRAYSVYGGHYTHEVRKATVWKTQDGAEKALNTRKDFLRSIGREREAAALRIVPLAAQFRPHV